MFAWQQPTGFAALNLRCNPFSELSQNERAQLAVLELPPLPTHGLTQIIADAGHGKTTHLLGLCRAQGGRYVYAEEGSRSFDMQGAPMTPVFVDEAQRLPARLLRKIGVSFDRVVFGTHDDLGAKLAQNVFTIRLEHLDAARLRRIVEARIAWARRGEGPLPAIGESLLARLLTRYRADVRAIEAELYVSFQRAAALARAGKGEDAWRVVM